MREDIKELLNAEADYSIETVDELAGYNVATDFFNNMKRDVDKFNKYAWENKTGYNTPNFKSFTTNLEGWSAGFYLWAGASNHGKSAIMLNVMADLCSCEENKLFGIYFSLDDSKDRIIPRIVAMNECLPISVIAKPGRYKQMIMDGHKDSLLYKEYLEKREVGLNNLKNDSNKLVIFDSLEVRTVDDIAEKCRQVYSYIKAIDPEMNLVIGIDSLKDIEIDEVYGGNKLTANDKTDLVSKKIKDLSLELKAVIFASYHLRKLNGSRRPTIDDLKDSNVLEYELDACFIVYNDVSRNGQSAKIFYKENEESTERLPVLEVDWAKNKLSSYKGTSFCNFSPEYSKCVEATKDAAVRYNALLFEV